MSEMSNDGDDISLSNISFSSCIVSGIGKSEFRCYSQTNFFDQTCLCTSFLYSAGFSPINFFTATSIHLQSLINRTILISSSYFFLPSSKSLYSSPLFKQLILESLSQCRVFFGKQSNISILRELTFVLSRFLSIFFVKNLETLPMSLFGLPPFWLVPY